MTNQISGAARGTVHHGARLHGKRERLAPSGHGRALGFLTALVTCALLAGCLRGSSRSNVANGEIYQPGEPAFDEYFKSLYAVQLTMGHAPEREQAAREGIAKVAGAPASASNDELSTAFEKRLAALSKNGLSLRVSVSGLDGDNPSAHVAKSGSSGAPAATEAEDTLEKSVNDAIALLRDLRQAKPELARLDNALPPLEGKVDDTFKSSRKKKKEVRENLTDARKLIPLMVARDEEVAGHVVELLDALEKASPPAIATPPPAESTSEKKPGRGGAAGHHTAKKKPKAGGEGSAPATPKPKPAEHFEP